MNEKQVKAIVNIALGEKGKGEVDATSSELRAMVTFATFFAQKVLPGFRIEHQAETEPLVYAAAIDTGKATVPWDLAAALASPVKERKRLSMFWVAPAGLAAAILAIAVITLFERDSDLPLVQVVPEAIRLLSTAESRPSRAFHSSPGLQTEPLRAGIQLFAYVHSPDVSVRSVTAIVSGACPEARTVFDSGPELVTVEDRHRAVSKAIHRCKDTVRVGLIRGFRVGVLYAELKQGRSVASAITRAKLGPGDHFIGMDIGEDSILLAGVVQSANQVLSRIEAFVAASR